MGKAGSRYFKFAQMIKKYFYSLRRIFYRLPLAWRFVLVAAVLAVFLVFSQFSLVLVRDGKMAAIRTPLGRALLTPYHAVKKIPDLWYVFYFFKHSDLPVYELTIDSKDLKFLNENLPEAYAEGSRLTEEYRQPVSAVFSYQGKEYKVKVNYRGYVGNHWANPKKSWDIDFKKGNSFNGLDGLKLIIPEDRGIVLEYLNHYRAKKMGLYPLQSYFAVLKVNGRNNGVYFVNEPWDKEYLAKYELLDETDMFAYDDNWERTDREFDSFEQLALYEKQADNPFDPFSSFSPLDKFFDLVNNRPADVFAKEIVKIVDLDSFLNWQAMHILGNSPHNVYRNIRFFVNRETGKLVFVPWDVNIVDPDSGLEKVTSDFYGKMMLVDDFAFKRNKILWNYVSAENNLADDLKYYDEAFKEIKPALARDRLKVESTWWFFRSYREIREQLIANFENVKNILSDARAAAVVYWQNGAPVYFDVANDKAPEISLKTVALEGVNQPISFEIYADTNSDGLFDAGDKMLKASAITEDNKSAVELADQIISAKRTINQSNQAGVWDTIAYSPGSRRFFIKIKDAGEIKDLKIELANALSGAKVEPKVQNINNDSYQYLSLIDQSVADFISQNYSFQKTGENELLLPAGNYVFIRDVIIPQKTRLTIAAGAKINLGSGVSIISYSPVKIAGRPESPVIFDAIDPDAPWGSFGISEAPQESEINYAIFKNGRDDHINGVYYSGMVSIYLSDVVVVGCQFSGANADDAINFKKSKVRVVKSVFSDNSADAIDFDYIKDGSVSESEFFRNGNDAIDLSGSSVRIENNYIEKSGDKCISIGEQSIGPVIYNNILNGCNIGIEVKDGSEVFASNNVIVNNSIGINGYRKKAIFPNGFIQVYNTIVWGNKELTKADDTIAIDFFNSDLSQTDGQNGNFSAEPPFGNPSRKDFTIRAENGNILFASGGEVSILKEKLGLEQNQAPVGLNR